MSKLFEPYRIHDLVLRNRFVRSATYDGMADKQGHVTDPQIAMVKALAEGGVGLIILGAVHVHPSGVFSPVQTSIVSDDCIPGLKRIADTAHERGARVAVQLFHAGRDAVPYQSMLGQVTVGPSYVRDDSYLPPTYRTLEEDEIWEVVGAFGDAAARARQAGIDAVQVHGAATYLLSQFLSPFANRRDDSWGGALENRLRIHLEILSDVRAKVGEDYPVLIKLGLKDAFEGGLTLEEGFAAAERLAGAGYDALEIHHGLEGSGKEEAEWRTAIETYEQEAYLSGWTREVKRRVDVPVILVGGVRSYERAEALIDDGDADLVSMSRPLIREPSLIRDWERGDHHQAACISCHGCLRGLLELKPLQCVAAG
jgi:2,4-dienoyl-CoA reductase-like NADH-dependent reductase (Old Yellow Enzyme family)